MKTIVLFLALAGCTEPLDYGAPEETGEAAQAAVPEPGEVFVRSLSEAAQPDLEPVEAFAPCGPGAYAVSGGCEWAVWDGPSGPYASFIPVTPVWSRPRVEVDGRLSGWSCRGVNETSVPGVVIAHAVCLVSP